MEESQRTEQSGAVAEGVSVSDIGGAIPSTRGIRLAKLAAAHTLALLLSLSMFAAADAWTAVSGLTLASLLAVVTGALAGVVIANVVHEWFHLLGARVTGARYSIPDKLGLFLYDWDFSQNNSRQFLVMSLAGTAGSVLAMILLFMAVPFDTWGRAALLAGAIASFVFGSFIEWPVIRRTRRTGKPMDELAKINGAVLSRSFTAAALTLVFGTVFIAP